MAQDGKPPYTTPDLFKSHMVMWENLLRARFELYSLLTSKASVECFLPEEISRIARAHMNLTNMLLPFTYWLAMEQCEEEHSNGVYSGKPTFACNRNGVANASVHDLVATRFTIDYSLIFANQGSTPDDMTEILPFMAALEAARRSRVHCQSHRRKDFCWVIPPLSEDPAALGRFSSTSSLIPSGRKDRLGNGWFSKSLIRGPYQTSWSA
jgi:hypothetical protein